MNKFLRAYLECALWLSTDEEGQPLDDVNSINDISEQTYSEAEADCAGGLDGSKAGPIRQVLSQGRQSNRHEDC